MKLQSKRFAAALIAICGLAAAGSVSAQNITGTTYLSNINPDDASFSGYWATTATITSTATGLEFNAPGGSSSFSTMYYSIPVDQQTVLDPLDTQVTFNFTWNSGNAVDGVNVLFALDDSLGGVNYYATGYKIPTPGLNSYTFDLQSPNAENVGSGAIINGMNFQIDPANVSGNYDITYNSISLHPANTPEPATFALLGVGLSGLLIFRRRAAK